MGFEPMISGMKILRPRPTRRTERNCCLKYLVYSNCFLSSYSWITADPQNLNLHIKFGNNSYIKKTSKMSLRAYETDQSFID